MSEILKVLRSLKTRKKFFLYIFKVIWLNLCSYSSANLDNFCVIRNVNTCVWLLYHFMRCWKTKNQSKHIKKTIWLIRSALIRFESCCMKNGEKNKVWKINVAIKLIFFWNLVHHTMYTYFDLNGTVWGKFLANLNEHSIIVKTLNRWKRWHTDRILCCWFFIRRFSSKRRTFFRLKWRKNQQGFDCNLCALEQTICTNKLFNLKFCLVQYRSSTDLK